VRIDVGDRVWDSVRHRHAEVIGVSLLHSLVSIVSEGMNVKWYRDREHLSPVGCVWIVGEEAA